MLGIESLCEISKDTFEISHKIWNIHFTDFVCGLLGIWIVTS